MNNQTFIQFNKNIKALLREERTTHKDLNYATNMYRQNTIRK
jgi:hypothetical protein